MAYIDRRVLKTSPSGRAGADTAADESESRHARVTRADNDNVCIFDCDRLSVETAQISQCHGDVPRSNESILKIAVGSAKLRR